MPFPRISYLIVYLAFCLCSADLAMSADASGDGQPDKKISKQRVLNQQIKRWVSQRESIAPQQVTPSVNDRRFKIPACEEDFEFSYPFSGKGTVKVVCRTPDWESFVRVRFSPKKILTHGFIYTNKFESGHILRETDIEMAVTNNNIKGLAKNAANIIGKSVKGTARKSNFIKLDVLKPTITAFEATKEIHKNDFFSANNYKRSTLGTHLVTAQHRFKEKRLKGSKAARHILPGDIISTSVIKSRYTAYTAADTISRGEGITDANIKRTAFWGTKPPGMIKAKKELRLKQASRTLRPGDILRISDIKPALLVKKGDSILLTVKKGALQVTVSVEALASGKINDVILLRNSDSGESIRGKITARGQATSLR